MEEIQAVAFGYGFYSFIGDGRTRSFFWTVQHCGTAGTYFMCVSDVNCFLYIEVFCYRSVMPRLKRTDEVSVLLTRSQLSDSPSTLPLTARSTSRADTPIFTLGAKTPFSVQNTSSANHANLVLLSVSPSSSLNTDSSIGLTLLPCAPFSSSPVS